MKTVKIAILGAGAVTQLYHLPAARSCSDIQVTALVDKNLDRARALAQRYEVTSVMSDYHGVFGLVDGVINALPHSLHAPVTIEFLEARIPVLVEKPMALNIDEAKAMVRSADNNGAAMQVSLKFRFHKGAQLVKQAINEGWLGTIQSFALESGFVFDWPATSGFFFSKEQSGGGVLIDTGSHMLDLLLWWLGDVVEIVEYRDDSMGGVEAECWLSLVLGARTGPVQGTVTLSRLRKLGDTACVVGDRFSIEYSLSTDSVRIWPSTCTGERPLFVSEYRLDNSLDAFVDQLRAFAKVIVNGEKSLVPGESVLGTVALVERCYRERQLLQFPWMKPIEFT